MEDNRPEKKDNVQPADNSGDGAFGFRQCSLPDAGLLGSSVSKLVSLGTVTLQPSNDYVPYVIPLENSSCNVSNPTSVPEAKSIVVVVIWKRRQRCKFGASRAAEHVFFCLCSSYA